jgi:hypothetical protein
MEALVIMKKLASKVLTMAVLTGVLVSGASVYAHEVPTSSDKQGALYVEAPKESSYVKVLSKMSMKDRVDFARAVKATAKYHDINKAFADGYEQEGPFAVNDKGEGMGVHFTKQSINHDTVLDPTQPETLLYEPQKDGSMKLVGIEYHVDADLVDHAPKIFGQTFDGTMLNHHLNPNTMTQEEILDVKNRHYDLHVWAWEFNPNGLFSQFNPNVVDKSLK